jgi:DNA invertase Pin-like site-specific DNA recombinase
MKVAIFARVSTNDGRQDNNRQTGDLLALAAQNGWQVEQTITEEISAAKSNDQRPGLQELLKLARSRKIKKVIVTEISRLGRKVSEGLQVIEELSKNGVSVYVQNIGIETLLSDGRENYMFKPILLTLMGFAEMERELLRDRVKSGLEAAKRRGKTLGRPTGSSKNEREIVKEYPAIVRALKAGELSIRQIAKLNDVAPNTVMKVKRALAGATLPQ